MRELERTFAPLSIDGVLPDAVGERLSWLASLDLETDDAGTATETARRVSERAFGDG